MLTVNIPVGIHGLYGEITFTILLSYFLNNYLF
jgi:hypothetical protein